MHVSRQFGALATGSNVFWRVVASLKTKPGLAQVRECQKAKIPLHGKSSKATGIPDARQEYLLFGKNHVWSKDCLCKSSQHVCLRSAVIFGSSSRIGELLMRKKRKPRQGKKHWLRPKRKRVPRCKPQTKQATRAVSMTVEM